MENSARTGPARWLACLACAPPHTARRPFPVEEEREAKDGRRAAPGPGRPPSTGGS